MLKKLIPDRKYNRFLLLACYGFIILNCGSIFYSWNGFIKLMYKAGSFEELCKGAKDITSIELSGKKYIDCGSRQYEVGFLSSLVVTVHIMSSPISGFLLDYFGNKVCYIISQFFYIFCWVLFAIFPKNKIALRFIFFIMGFFSEAQILPLIAVKQLFPNNEFLIISILGSIRSLSFSIPLILGAIFSLDRFKPDDFYIICIIYIFVSIVPSLIIGIITLPWTFKTPEQLEDDKKKKEECNAVSLKDKFNKTLDLVKYSIKNPLFFECVLAAVCVYTQMARVDILNKAHLYLYATTDGQSAATTVSYFMVLAFIPCPMFGWLSDNFGPPIVLLILQIFGIISIVFLPFDNIVMKYISSVGFFFSCSYFISNIYSYISWRIEPLYFGTVCGVILFVVGLLLNANIGFLRIATEDIFKWAPRNYDIIPYIFLSHTIVGLICSLYLCYRTRNLIGRNAMNNRKAELPEVTKV